LAVFNWQNKMAEHNLRPLNPLTESGNDAPTGDEVSYDFELASVLQDVLDTGLPGESVLFLKSASSEIRGCVLIQDSRFIVAAVNRELTGFDALKYLLTIRKGSYKWSHTEADLENKFDRTLNIDLSAIIPSLPWVLEAKLDKVYDKKAKRAAKSYMTLHSIQAAKKEDESIKLPRELRERLVHGVSLAHTVERNFETIGNANSKRLEKRGRSFDTAKNDSILVPIYVVIGALMVMVAAGAEWAVLNMVFPDYSVKHKVHRVHNPH
jgi:hypothetical protein